jgi:Fe-S-cluster containining protein
MELHFGCTQCGKCCHGLKIPLTVAESLSWLEDGNDVQIVCEARFPDADRTSSSEPPGGAANTTNPAQSAHFTSRSFAARTGGTTTRIVATMVANTLGACANLRPDSSCGIYARRPLVCRIYPAEINPNIELKPESKGCPPEAWARERPVYARGGHLIDAGLREDIQRWRATIARDVEVMRRICWALALKDAALYEEGLVIHAPPRELLRAALSAAQPTPDAAADDAARDDWRLASDRPARLADLRRGGALACASHELVPPGAQYVGLRQRAAVA